MQEIELNAPGPGPTWQTWNPTISGLTLGSGGLITARYLKTGKLVVVRFHMILGASPTVPSNPILPLPVTAAALVGSGDFEPMGLLNLRDASPAQVYFGYPVLDSTTGVMFRVSRTDGTYAIDSGISSTAPFTWTINDQMFAKLYYEAA